MKRKKKEAHRAWALSAHLVMKLELRHAGLILGFHSLVTARP
jgi:hypothetical protein